MKLLIFKQFSQMVLISVVSAVTQRGGQEMEV